jgi:hypothetical protein
MRAVIVIVKLRVKEGEKGRRGVGRPGSAQSQRRNSEVSRIRIDVKGFGLVNIQLPLIQKK